MFPHISTHGHLIHIGTYVRINMSVDIIEMSDYTFYLKI